MNKATTISAVATIHEFRARTYEILERNGSREIDGELYYPESAIMDALEFLYQEMANITITNFEAKLLEATERAIQRLGGQRFIQGASPENTDGFTG